MSDLPRPVPMMAKAELPASRTSKVRCCESCSWASPKNAPINAARKPAGSALAYSCHIRRSDSGAIRLVASSPWVSSSSAATKPETNSLSSPKHVSSALQGVRGLREEITALTERRPRQLSICNSNTASSAHPHPNSPEMSGQWNIMLEREFTPSVSVQERCVLSAPTALPPEITTPCARK
ncbi:unknown [Eggerthella sp. CAG:209]|nr:unknown [Eggerthella sp. CAG:209]